MATCTIFFTLTPTRKLSNISGTFNSKLIDFFYKIEERNTWHFQINFYSSDTKKSIEINNRRYTAKNERILNLSVKLLVRSN